MGALPDEALWGRFGSARFCSCLLRQSRFAWPPRGTPRTPNELAGHDCVSYTALLLPDVWTFPSDKTNFAVRVHSRLVVGSAGGGV